MATDLNTGKKKVVKTKTPTPMGGSKGWGSVRAAEYGIPSLALNETFIPTGLNTSGATPPAPTGVGSGASNPYANLMDSLTGMYNQAQGQIGSATNNLIDFLNQQKNPYAGQQAQAVQATPQLQELLQSQGVNTSPLQQLAAVTQAQNTGQTTAFNNLNTALSNMWNAGQSQQLQNAATEKANMLQSLVGSTMGYGNSLLGKKNPNRQALIQLINALSGAK